MAALGRWNDSPGPAGPAPWGGGYCAGAKPSWPLELWGRPWHSVVRDPDLTAGGAVLCTGVAPDRWYRIHNVRARTAANGSRCKAQGAAYFGLCGLRPGRRPQAKAAPAYLTSQEAPIVNPL